MPQNKTLELSFHVPERVDASLGLTAEFSDGDTKITVNGFYDGGDTWKVRFLPQKAGTWHWNVKGVSVQRVNSPVIVTRIYTDL